MNVRPFSTIITHKTYISESFDKIKYIYIVRDVNTVKNSVGI